MATKYSITEPLSTTEFATYEQALDYKTQNNIDAPIDTIEYDVPNEAVPLSVTPRQIRQALIVYGIAISTIEDALNNLPEPTKTLAGVEWEYSLSFERYRPLVISVSELLGWTPEQLDALWILAGSL